MDTNIPAASIAWLGEHAGVPIFADPVSTAKAGKLRPVLVAEGQDGATTVTTMIIAHMAGISVFATGGIGGVHRSAQQAFDISADLEKLAHTP